MRLVARLLGLCVLASTAVVGGVGSPAYAVAQSKVWVDPTRVLRYEYAPTAPAVNLRIRTSGDTFIVQDAYGMFIGAGCTYPTENAALVHCTGVSSVVIDTGPHNDRVDFLATGIHADTETTVNLYGGKDTFFGGESRDTVRPGDGDDVINTYGGPDIVFSDGGADRVNGGSGDDEMRYISHPSGVVVDLDGALYDDGIPGEGDSIGADVEYLTGSAYDDILIGNASDNGVDGCGGSDYLNGLAGDDSMSGDNLGACGPRGSDVMIGGPGIDIVSYTLNPVGVVVDLTSTAATDGEPGEGDQIGPDVENLRGGDGNDILIGSSGANVIHGLGGRDFIYGLDGDDSLHADSGDYDRLYGGNGADSLYGGLGVFCDLGPGGLIASGC